MSARLHILGLLGTLVMVTPAAAAQIFSTGYDTPNGDGVAHSGSFNYWDKFYTGAGATTTDGAFLSGGHGDLTDGVVAPDFWFNVENAAGEGPYVGWRGDVGVSNPIVTFHFAGAPLIDTITIHLDNSLLGGVGAPAHILVDGVDQPYVAPAAGTIGTVTLAGLNLTGASHTIQFQQDPTYVWTFVSEVSFFGGAVPEPASWAMMILGFGAAGAVLRRRREHLV